jgi:glycosyltransferase involved in cell wall biosynthesis
MVAQTKSSIAVVIVSKDEASLSRTLKALKPQCEKLKATLIVVDASEKRLDWLRQEHLWVTWFDYTPPIGRAFSIPQQRNFGVLHANADIIAFCDSGSVPTPEWLADLTGPIAEGLYRVTSGPIISNRESIYRSINDHPTGTVVPATVTANLAFETAAFVEVGGFNEAYDYGSDVDFGYRLLDKGVPPVSIQTARMIMHWGEWGLQTKRSWRYGRARARLLHFNPRRRLEILKDSRIVFVYPPLVMYSLWAVIAAFGLNLTYLVSALAIFMSLLWRNRSIAKPWKVIVSHIIYSGGMIYEFASRFVARKPIIVVTPKDKNPYQHRLRSELLKLKVEINFDREPTKSATINLLLWPIRFLALRVGGTKILHLHWPDQFVPIFFRTRPGRAFAYSWLLLCLKSLKLLSLKLIYTAHNHEPHEKLFNDDAKASQRIYEAAAAVIVHNESSRSHISQCINPNRVYLIPEGVDYIHQAPKAQPKDGDSLNLVMIGQVRNYKGITDVLSDLASTKPRTQTHLLIAGECTDPLLKSRIESLASQARLQGWGITTRFAYLPESEVNASFGKADAALFAFRRVANSGSVLRAIANGTPVLVPDNLAFAHLPLDVKITHQSGNFAHSINGLSNKDLFKMRKNLLAFSEKYGWEDNARAHLELYREVANAR